MSHSAGSTTAPEPTGDAPAAAPTVVHVEQARTAKAYATDAFDVALYIASGLMLIFMMETFVQMGARMRY